MARADRAVRDGRPRPRRVVRRAGAPPSSPSLRVRPNCPRRRLLRAPGGSASAAQAGQHVVVTAGTGSGKTESFLLPLLLELLERVGASGQQTTTEQSNHWWRAEKPEFVAERATRRGRRAAVRALVLYPMNALVDDQLQRLRAGARQRAARAWLDAHRGGHRFYFGRYTGRTPLAGPDRTELARQRCAGARTSSDATGARASACGTTMRSGYFLPQLDGAEMRSRWDMQELPPDILITNYSMLNVMLLRGIEEPIFDEDAPSGSRRSATTVHGRRSTSCTCTAERLAPRSRSCCATCSTGSASPTRRTRSGSWPRALRPAATTEKFDRFIEGFFAHPRVASPCCRARSSIPSFDRRPCVRSRAGARSQQAGSAFGVATTGG